MNSYCTECGAPVQGLKYCGDCALAVADMPQVLNQGNERLVVAREKAFKGAAMKWLLLVDDVPVGTLANGGMLACPVGAGKHKIGVSISSSRSVPVEIDLPTGTRLLVRLAIGFKKGVHLAEQVQLSQAEFDALGAPEIEMSDGAPKRRILPNHTGTVLMAGIAAWIIGILGLWAFGRGMQDLGQIKKGEMASSGRPAIIFGMISGALGFFVNAAYLISRCTSGNF